MAASHGSRLAHDERRDQLIEMGLQLLGQRSYDQISITEIARASGISKGLLYHYFPTKNDFVIAVLRRAREDLDTRIAFDPTLDAAGRLDAALDAFLSFAEEHAAGFQAIARARTGGDDAIRAELAEGRQQRIGWLMAFGAALADVGLDELASPALEAAVGGWLASSEEVIVRWLSRRELTREAVRHLLRQSLLAAYASVAAVDGTAAAARLAEAAERAMQPVVA
jgi:AcrR family transcriptional regulator